MKQYISASFKKHTLIYIYSFVILLLTFGVYSDSGSTHMSKMLIYAVTLFAVYIALHFIGFRSFLSNKLERIKNPFTEKRTNFLLFALLGLVILTFVLHHIMLGGSPIFKAMSFTNKTDIAQVRRSITADAPRLLNYFVSFNLRAFIPFLILIFFVKNKKIFYWLMLVIGCFYAFSLMQKSYVICILAPVLFYSLFQKKYWHSVLHVALISLVIYGQFVIANPSANRATDMEVVSETPIENKEETILLETPIDTVEHDIVSLDTLPNDHVENSEEINSEPISTPIEDSNPPAGSIKDEFTPSYQLFSRFFGSLASRLAFAPGKTASAWFNIVPAQKPFLNGDGYRWLARLKGSTYHNYFLELYPIMYPEHASTGLKGSVNTAGFVVGYSNFGRWGLVISGFILALFLIFVEALFEDDYKIKFSLNIYAILIISSTMLTTTLLTHGWAFLLIMYVIFLSKKRSTN